MAIPPPTRLRSDAMYAFTRYLQTQAYRAQKRRDEGAEARKTQKELWRRTPHPPEPDAEAPPDRVEPVVEAQAPGAEGAAAAQAQEAALRPGARIAAGMLAPPRSGY